MNDQNNNDNSNSKAKSHTAALKEASAQLPTLRQDLIWESVLEVLSQDGKLAQFYRLPRHEMNAYMKAFGQFVPGDLKELFRMTQQGLIKERTEFVARLSEGRTFAILLVLGRSMKCWVESESTHGNFRRRWKIAHA